MKILFITKSEKAPSARIRVINYLPALLKKSITYECLSLTGSLFNRIKILKSAQNFDLVFLQKKLLNKFEFNLLRKNSKFLIYDFDDAVYYDDLSKYVSFESSINSKRRKIFERTLLNSDLIIAANSILAQEAYKSVEIDKIIVLPSPVYFSDSIIKLDYEIYEKPIIGWIGVSGNFKHIEYVYPALLRLKEETDFVLNIISDKPILLKNINIHFTQWSKENEYENIKKFDIGIMPLINNKYSEGKSSYKLLQYMSVGIPSVCSSVGMNKEVALNGICSLLAETVDDFYFAMKVLINSKGKREKMGKESIEFIRKSYSYEVLSQKLIDLFCKIVNQ